MKKGLSLIIIVLVIGFGLSLMTGEENKVTETTSNIISNAAKTAEEAGQAVIDESARAMAQVEESATDVASDVVSQIGEATGQAIDQAANAAAGATEALVNNAEETTNESAKAQLGTTQMQAAEIANEAQAVADNTVVNTTTTNKYECRPIWGLFFC